MRVALHAINGTGVGHLTRAGLVLDALCRRVAGLQALLCTNATDAVPLRLPGAARVVRLPYTTVDEAAAGDDPTPREVNARAFFAAAAAFEPDLLVFDTHAPQALLRDRGLEAVPRALILRSLTPAAAARLFSGDPSLGAAFDLILVPADVGAAPLPVPAPLSRRLRRVGPIVRPPAPPEEVARVAARFDLQPDTLVVVGTLGGGGPQLGPGKRALVHDARDFGLALGLAFRRLARDFPRARLFLQLGPHGANDLPAELSVLAPAVTVLRYDPDVPALLQRADVAVALSGYNTVWELLQSQVPAVLLCKRARHESQLDRAAALVEGGAAAEVLTEPDAHALYASVAELLSRPERRQALRAGMAGLQRARADLDRGADQAAGALLELLHDPPALVAPPPCAAPCAGCPVVGRAAVTPEQAAAGGARRVLVQCSAGQGDVAELLGDLRGRGLVPIVETTGRMAQSSDGLRAALLQRPALRPLLFGGWKKLHDRACGAPGSFAATLDLVRAHADPAGPPVPVPSWRLRTVRGAAPREDRLRPIDRHVLLRAHKSTPPAEALPLVVLLRRRWLPYSEGFIYQEARSLTRHRPLALCKETAGTLPPAVPVLPLGDTPPDRVAPLLLRAGVRLLHGTFLSCAASFLGLHQALGVPLVVSARGHDVYRRPPGGPRALHPVFAAAARVLARTEEMAGDLRALGCPADKVVVLPTGLDLSRFPFRAPAPPVAGEPLRVIAVGRFVAKKGLPDVLRAFAALAQDRPEALLQIYGLGHADEDPAQVAAARELADSAALRGRVELLPAVPQEVLAEALARSHLFVCAPREAPDGDREGLPNAVKEAMAVGLPVLATAHGGLAGLLGPAPGGSGSGAAAGPAGVLVPEGDLAALREELVALSRQPERWGELARAARARVEQAFDLPQVVARLEAIYDEVCG